MSEGDDKKEVIQRNGMQIEIEAEGTHEENRIRATRKKGKQWG